MAVEENKAGYTAQNATNMRLREGVTDGQTDGHSLL